jgi:hypothetical protein
LFAVKPTPLVLPGLRPLLSGVTFGFFDRPMEFEVSALGAPGPIKVEFVCHRDKAKPAFAAELSRTSGALVQVKFFNPTEGGTSGLLAPVMVIAAHSMGLTLMFHVDVVGGGKATAYRFTYEFGEAPIGATDGGLAA